VSSAKDYVGADIYSLGSVEGAVSNRLEGKDVYAVRRAVPAVIMAVTRQCTSPPESRFPGAFGLDGAGAQSIVEVR
jgi:hypothetical protein